MGDNIWAKEEEWKVVDGFPKYEVSNRHHVRDIVTKTEVESHYVGTSLKVSLKDNSNKTRSVHVKNIMANAFCGGPREGYRVCFKDGNRQNLHADNLGWERDISESEKCRTVPVIATNSGKTYESLYDYCEKTGEKITNAKRAIRNPGRYVANAEDTLEWME